MADVHTPVERKLKTDILSKNKTRREMEKSMFLIGRLSEKLKKCKNHQKLNRYNSTITRHRKKVEQLRTEISQMNEELEKRIKQEMKYSETEVNEFKAQLEKEIREVEEVRAKIEKSKEALDKSEKPEEKEALTREIALASRRLLREAADVKEVENELNSEEKDKILFTQELKRIEGEKLLFKQ